MAKESQEDNSFINRNRMPWKKKQQKNKNFKNNNEDQNFKNELKDFEI